MIYPYKRRRTITLPSDLLDTLESFAYSRNRSLSELIGAIALSYDPEFFDASMEAYEAYDRDRFREYEDQRDKELEEQMMHGYL